MKTRAAAALRITERIVTRHPRRLAGTQSCRDAAREIQELLGACSDPGSIRSEAFRCGAVSFLKLFRLYVLAYVMAVAAVWLGLPLIGVGSLLVSGLLFSYTFLFLRPGLDRLMPQIDGTNVSSRLDPTAEVRCQIVLGGHHDAGYVFHLMERAPRLYPLICLLGVAADNIALGLLAVACIVGVTPVWMRVVVTALGVLVAPQWFFTSRAVSPGAGDNMIATAMAMEVMRLFAAAKAANEDALRHTRLVFLSTDAEEMGLRGARAYVKAHGAELRSLPTKVLCMDTLYHRDKLVFLDRDVNRSVKLSRGLAEELCGVARSLGYGATVTGIPLGGGATDAAVFQEAGIDATCVLALELDPRRIHDRLAYHTTRDVVAAIEPEAVEQVLTLLVTYVRQTDAAWAGGGRGA